MAEIRLILTHLLYRFDVNMVDETDRRWTEQKGWFTWAKTPLIVGLQKVEH